jgi:hypothetical protein
MNNFVTSNNSTTKLHIPKMPARSLSGLSTQSPVSVLRWTDDGSASSSTVDGGKHGDKSRGPIRKRIQFAEQNEIRYTEHLDEIPDEEIAAIWYDSEEYAEIKQSYQITIFMMESGEELKPDEHTSRGLEYRTQEGAWARYENKRDAYNAVLDEQDRQWKVDKDDFERLRAVYLNHSTKCADAAHVRAKQDEKEARKIYRSILPPKLRRSVNESDASGVPRKSRTGSLASIDSVSSSSSRRREDVRDDIKRLERKSFSQSKSRRDAV